MYCHTLKRPAVPPGVFLALVGCRDIATAGQTFFETVSPMGMA
jgi:hypothetical protein